MYSVTHLPNGLAVATAAMPHMASVSVGVWVGVGSRYESAGLNGTCHFIEHLLFKGTDKRTARDISEAVEGIGGYLNAFTSEEFTCFHARACADRFVDLLEVLCDMLLHSRFARADVLKERDVIKDEVAMYLDQPQHHVQELLNETLWPDQPLGRPITGTVRGLDNIHRTQMLRFLRGNYVTGNTVIAVAGNVDHGAAVDAAQKLTRRFPAGHRPHFSPAADGQTAPRLRLFTRDVEQTQIALGIRTCSRHDERRHALRLLNAILGENMSSRLFQIVREDKGLAYSIYSTPSFFHDTGDLVISAGLDSANVAKTLRLTLLELRKLAAKSPGHAELRRARDYLIGQNDLALESTDNQMNWVGENLLSYGRIENPARLKSRLRSITPSDIREIASAFFRPERCSLALVSPLKSTLALEKLLHF